MRALSRAMLCAALVAQPGCSHRRAVPSAPIVAPVSPVRAVFPSPRSSGIFYDTPIWVEFDTPLDSASVNERTVYLKLDTRRIAITPRYDSASRRIRVEPRDELELLLVYTIELSPQVETAAGISIGGPYKFQFMTNSLRRPDDPGPPDGSETESPLAAFRWNATEPSAGKARYNLFFGDDSAAVAARQTSPRVLQRAYDLAPVRWAVGTRYFWAVTVENLTTGEKLEGPVRSFRTLVGNTPTDSLVVSPADWAYFFIAPNQPSQSREICMTGDLISGYPYNAAIRWRLRADVPDLRLFGARLTFTMSNPGDRDPSVWSAKDEWPMCGVSIPGPPFSDSDGLLASGLRLSGNRVRFESDRLTSHLEAMTRYLDFHGYVLNSASPQAYYSPGDTVPPRRPELKLYFYRLSQAAQRLAAGKARAHTH